MPLRKGWKKAKARRTVLQKAVRDVLDSDGPVGGDADCADTLPDEGRDDPTDLTWSVPIAASAIWPSDSGTNVHTSVLGSNKQMEAKPRLFKPSGPSVKNLLKLADLPKDLLDTLPKDLPDDLPKAFADDCLTNTIMDTMNEVATEGHNGGLKDCLSKNLTDFDLKDSSDNNSKKNIGINPSRISDKEKEMLHMENIESEIVDDMNVDDMNCSHQVQKHMSDTSHVYSRGPFSCRSMTFGSFSQSNSKFSIYSRGSQCTMNSLCALIHVQYSSVLNRSSLDEILIEGDQLYKTVIQNLKNAGRFKHRLLCLDEIPDCANAFAKFVNIEKADIVSGIAVIQYNQSSLPTLHQSLEKALLCAKHVLVMIGAVCSAVFLKDSYFWLFDSHSHGSDGLSSYDGRSILMSFSSFDDLVTFMYAMYESMSIDLSGQYEILPVKLNISAIEHTSTSDLLSKYFEDQKKRTEKLTDSHSCKHKDCLDLAAEEKNAALKIKDRKEYFRKYQQARRSDRQFKVKERNAQKASKRIARADPLFKEREKQIQKKSKEKFRDDILFKEREKEIQKKSKEKFRDDILFKEREKEIQKKSKEKFRADILFKEKEKQIQKRSKQNAREDILFRENENESQKKAKAKARKDSFFKEKERCNLNFLIRNLRKDSSFKENEKEMQNLSKRKARENPTFKDKEKDVQKLSKKKAREDPTFKGKEKDMQNLSKRKARENPTFKDKEKDVQKLSKKKAREDPTFKGKEKVLQKFSKKKAREDPTFKGKEKDMQKLSKKKAREDPTFKDKEKDVQKLSKMKARDDPLFKARETTSQNILKQKARESPYIKEKDRLAKKKERSDIRAKEKELILDKIRKRQKRSNLDFHYCEKLADLKKKHGSSIDQCIDLFHSSIQIGPQYICTCCKQTWFKQSVSAIKSITRNIDKQFLTGTVSVDGLEWICTTCKTSLNNKKVPKLSVKNGMTWPEKPKELELYPLEERLISLRIPFMQIRELPRGRQYSVKGNVVNVPVDIQPVVNALPRPFDENVTVAVKLKKKLSYKSCAFTENVRPLRVLMALHWLKRNSLLYKNSAVTIDEDWVTRVTNDCEDTALEFFSSDFSKTKDSNVFNKTDSDASDSHYTHDNDSSGNLTYDSDAEENVQDNVGNIDTLVDNADIENRNTLTFAPGEGQRPLSIYQDEDSEFLCFPTIFCGQRRKENSERLIPVSYGDIAKCELRSHDRRAANSVPNIFFKLKKIQMKQLNDKVNLAVRRGQFESKQLTAAQAKDSSCMEEMVKKDEGYYIFKQLRNSPAYLETRKKDIFAMIRQLGLPTWFMSLSSADTRWSDLLNMLSKLNNDTECSAEEIQNMTWEQKTKLIQKDPVTCSRYFDHRVHQFIKIVLKSSHDCLGEVTDFFYRVEFQQRGSPHVHMLVWVKNAPKYNKSCNEEITEYVDKYLTCSSDKSGLQDLIQLQMHKHSRTCHKKEDRICRFGYPLPPLKKTMVLEPLESDVDKYKKMYETLQKKMNAEKEGYEMPYEQFLTEVVGSNEEEYIKCLRSSLKASKVFLKRAPKDIRLNLYNETVLRAWKANIDIQFVLDPYACAMYIVSYISKSQRGMSSLLYAAAKEARNGNLDVKRQVRHIGNVFSNCVEVSAQEAVYLVLQMPLTKGTRDVVFINTSQPNQRIQLLKSRQLLDELPESSTDVVADNVIKRYSRRPRCLENWCLADYVSQLDIVYPDDKYDTSSNEKDLNDDDDSDISPQLELNGDQTLIVLKNGIKIRKRKNQKILRYVRFNKKSDEENHFREKLLLFLPWKNECTDLIGNHESYKQHYELKKRQIDMKCKEYEHHIEELEKAIQAAELDNSAFDEIAPATQQAEAEAELEDSFESEAFVYFNPDRAIEHREHDLGIELGCNSAAIATDVNEHLLPDENYRELLKCLNTKQRQFYNHVVHWIKTKDAPLYAFLTGGAGVGKSVVIKALYQTLYRYLNLSEGQNADEKRVLLCAYTGKAAYNINGSTISNAFHQKFKQKEQTLNCDTLNTFRSKYRNLSVIIIDEVSMVSNFMLKFIDQRLQELTGTQIPFGGKTIIAVGDLYQLKPVAGSWIFQDLTKDASALASNLWQEHFTVFELTEIMRQKDDSEFAELLNRLRQNKLTDNDRERIKKCHIDPSSSHYPQDAPHIFAENSFMQAFNDKMINSIKSQKVDIPCHDSIVGANISQEKQNKILEKMPRDANLTMGLHDSLTIVIGMIYDLTVNVDTEDGLTNGASCIVKHVEYKQTGTNRPSIIWVKFDDQHIGIERRKKYQNRGFFHGCIDHSWTPIFDIERTFQFRRNTFQRIQFPLQPSAGRTVHRAQGTTLEQVVIDLSQRRIRKNPHIHYVALSRVRSIRNLHILNFNEEAMSVDDKVTDEMERLHSEAKLELCYVPLDTINSDQHFKIAYNNCRSLHKHYKDVVMDQNIQSAHVICFAETRLVQRDRNADYSMNGFCLVRNDQDNHTRTGRPPHGLAVYIKDDINILKQTFFRSASLEFIVLHVKYSKMEIQIAVVYKAPGLSLNNLLSKIRTELEVHIDSSEPFLIIGDFNVDVSGENNQFEQKMNEIFHCQQLIHEPTTDLGSTLDLIFSNHSGSVGTVETYWSDHKIVYFYTK